jgi:hypothetical protein
MDGNTATDERPEPVRVATVPTYGEATDAIEWLSSARFPIDRATIVARDLKLVERVVGTRTRRRAAADGAGTGVVVGGGVGILLGLLSEGVGVAGTLFWGAILGALIGALLALALHAWSERRPFESVRTLDAAFYDVLVEERVAQEAVGILTEWAIKDPARRLETRLAEPELS